MADLIRFFSDPLKIGGILVLAVIVCLVMDYIRSVSWFMWD